MAYYTARALIEFHITPMAFIDMPATEQAFIIATLNEMDKEAEKAEKQG